MSRRKQAKPRALKREDLQSAMLDDESSQDTLSFTDIKIERLSPIERLEVSSTVSDEQTWLGDGEEIEEQPPTCEGCKLQFDSIADLLDHINQDCINGGLTCAGAGSGGSLRSSDTPDDLSSPGGCPTPSSSSGDPADPAEITFTVGVTENTPYGCQFCDKAFPRLTYLKRHEQIHSDQMPFRCDYCQRLFKHKRSRDRHVKLHTGDRKYRCSQCESAFSRSDHLKIHMKTHDNGKPYQCAVCNRGYNTAAALSSHMQNHKKAEASLVQQGATATTASDSLAEKESRDDDDTPDPPKPLLCNLCPQICSSPTALGEHVLQFHRSLSSPVCESPRPANTKSCSKCIEELASPNAVCSHRKASYEQDSEKSKQEINKGATDRFSPSSKLTCGFCSKSDFPTFESLQLHVQVLHLPPGGIEASLAASMRSLLHKKTQNSHTDPFQNYPGFDCESSFSAFHFLQKQAAVSDNFMMKRPNDTYCSQCNIGFTSSAALLDHVHMLHENVQVQRSTSSPNHSSKRSMSNSRLRPNGAKHLKPSSITGSHSTLYNGAATSHYRRQDPGGGQSPLNSGQNVSPNNSATLLCSQCNAGFSDFESFRNHLKSHLDAAAAPSTTSSQQRSYSCPECGAEMSSESQLDNHVAGHYLSSSTEYGCQSCLKIFSKPDELQKHLMDVHAYHLYRCALCKQMFDSKVSIQVHFAVKHSNECRSLRCTSCNAFFRTELEFQVHVKIAHLSAKNFNATNYRCLLCDQLFPNEIQLQYHAATHKKQFSCTVCGEAFHIEFLLDRHMQTVHQEANASSPPLHHFAGIRKSSPVPQQCSPGGTPCPQQNDEAQNLCTKKSSNGQPIKDQQSTDIPPSAPTVSSPVSSTVSTSPSSGRHKESKSNCGSSSGASVVSLFCAYCNESCKSRRELENHMKSHASPSKHKCNICDEICPSATTLAEHKLTHCKVVSGSTCIVCRIQLLSEDQFLSHLQQHNSPNGNNNGLPVPCVVCRQTLVVDVEVRMHARFHLKNASLESSLVTSAPCCVCSRMFDPSNLIIRGSVKSSSNSLPSHTYMCKSCFHSKGESDVCRCSECGVKFETSSDLEVHRRMVHPQKKTFQCIKCQMSFETEAEIQAHVTCHVLKEGTHLECKLCHEVLDSPSKLQCHLIEHTYEGSSHFTCYLCASVFTGSHLLQRHMLEHGLDARPYDCTDCNQKFFFRAELENHSFVHMWENMKKTQTRNNAQTKSSSEESFSLLYECRKCPGVFGNIVDLTNHQSSHNHETSFKQEPTNDRSNSCSVCGMEFNSKEDLVGHMMLTHPSATGYESLHAERGSQQDLYQFDEDSQENESIASTHDPAKFGREKKSFECPFCRKRFPRKEARKLHMKSHHTTPGMKGYNCNHCDKLFLKRSHLKEHMRTHITSTTHSCEICDESFPSNSILRKHLRDIHNRRYEHTCIVCDELFDDEKSLLVHQEASHQVRVEDEIQSDEIQSKSVKTSPVPSPEATTSTELRHHRSSSNDAESSDTVIDTEIKSDTVDFKEQEERTSLPAEVAA